jgi:hypothetical protein
MPEGIGSLVQDLRPSVVANTAPAPLLDVPTAQQSDVVGHDTSAKDWMPGQGFAPISTQDPELCADAAAGSALATTPDPMPIRAASRIALVETAGLNLRLANESPFGTSENPEPISAPSAQVDTHEPASHHEEVNASEAAPASKLHSTCWFDTNESLSEFPRVVAHPPRDKRPGRS